MKFLTLVLTALALVALSPLARATGQALRSDFDSNGSVNFTDFVLFAQAYGGSNSVFDLDRGGTVDFSDFLLFVADYQAHGAQGPQPSWSAIEPSGSVPVARLDHSLTLDPVRRRLVLFGGKTLEFLGDTWIFDLGRNEWREVLAAPSPDPRRGHAAVYDAVRDRLVLFGGQRDGFFNDVWSFDLATETWSELSVSGEKPVPRYGTSAIVDPVRERMVVSHGFSSGKRFDDTWGFDLVANRWANLTPGGARPLNRCLHDAILDPGSDRMLLFGGCSSGYGPCPQGDLWALDLVSNRWTELQPSGDRPAARSNLRLNHDPAGDRMLMFGGGIPIAQDDLWEYELENDAWRSITTGGDTPPARWSHEAVVDTANSRLILFGGTNGAVRFDDTWTLDY